MPAWDSHAEPTTVTHSLKEGSLRRQNLLVLVLLCGTIFLLCCIRGATKPFWFDEIATVHIAAAPSWHELLARSRVVDLHPPLEAVLVRFSFALFGPHEFGGRLPSVVAFTIATGSLFVLLRRRMHTMYAVFGALLPLSDASVAYYATEARPYAMMFGAVSLALLAYDSILLERRLTLARITLACSLVVLLQVHLFGTLAVGSFAFAELIRSWRHRRIDWSTGCAVLLPWMTCVTYIPLIRMQGSSGTQLTWRYSDRSSFLKGVLFYHEFLYVPLAPLTKIAALSLLAIPYFPTRSLSRFFGLKPSMAALLTILLASPIVIALTLHLRAPTSGFFLRYGIASVCPAFLISTSVVAWRAGQNHRVGVLLMLGAIVASAITFSDIPGSLRIFAKSGLFSAPAGLEQTGGVEKVCPRLPLVMNNALQFLEADNRLGTGVETRMVYLTDPAEALRLEHENITESVASMSRVFQTQHKVVEAGPFLQQQPAFLLLTRLTQHEWLGDFLLERHVEMRYLGQYTFAGERSNLWLVLQAGASGPNFVCPAQVFSK